jgi:hypothetical protein
MKKYLISYLMTFAIVLSISLVPLSLHAEEENEKIEVEQPEETVEKTESKKLDVKVTKINAQISPQLELTLPSGNVYEHFVEDFNNLRIIFDLNYNFLNNSIGGDLTFKYPIKRFEPGIKFFLDLDFENFFYPQLEGGEFTILPTEKYISRRRGLELSLSYNMFRNFYVIPAFLINDSFRGSLTTSSVIEEGTDLTARTSFVYDSLRAKDPDKRLAFEGIYYRSVFDARFRNSFDNPVSIDNVNNFLFRFNFWDRWYLGEKVNLSYPIKIWNRDLGSFYSLGGFDSIRGYEFRSINAFRFIHLSTNLEVEILRDKELKFKVGKLQTRMHQYRVFLLLDELLTQESLSLGSRVNFFSSIGTGFSFVLSGKKKGHFKIETYIAQPLEKGGSPLLYFRTSLYKLEKKL